MVLRRGARSGGIVRPSDSWVSPYSLRFAVEKRGEDMGIAYDNDASGVAVEVWDAEVTMDEIRAHVGRLSTDPKWISARAYVSDITTMATTPSDEAVAELAAEFRAALGESVGKAHWGIIATTLYEQVTMFGMHIRDDVPNAAVFSSLESACAWCGVDSAPIIGLASTLRARLRAA
jgi:hypothetical protein